VEPDPHSLGGEGRRRGERGEGEQGEDETKCAFQGILLAVGLGTSATHSGHKASPTLASEV
jgi:hypothetical protein